eukprot:5381183-Pleurochrysis_carterae.AAC.1
MHFPARAARVALEEWARPACCLPFCTALMTSDARTRMTARARAHMLACVQVPASAYAPAPAL